MRSIFLDSAASEFFKPLLFLCQNEIFAPQASIGHHRFSENMSLSLYIYSKTSCTKVKKRVYIHVYIDQDDYFKKTFFNISGLFSFVKKHEFTDSSRLV